MPHIFFHPDYNRWSRSCTGSADVFQHPVADYTASGDFHPALKTFIQLSKPYYTQSGEKCNPYFYLQASL